MARNCSPVNSRFKIKLQYEAFGVFAKGFFIEHR